MIVTHQRLLAIHSSVPGMGGDSVIVTHQRLLAIDIEKLDHGGHDRRKQFR